MKPSLSLVLAALIMASSLIAIIPSTGDAAQGNKDEGGYMYTDGKDPDPKVECEYIDVSSHPSRVGLDTSQSSSLSTVMLPFDFPYYGGTYDRVHISGHGAMSFVDNNNANYQRAYYHSTIPNSQAPRGILAVYYSYTYMVSCQDNNKGRLFHLTTQIDGEDVFIVEWNPTQGGKFQAMLHRNGAIKYQYLSVPGSYPAGSYALIGIEKPDDTTGVEYLSLSYRSSDQFPLPFAIMFHKDEVTLENGRLTNGDGLSGNDVYAGSKDYLFTVDVWHSQSWESIFMVSMTLSPDHESIRVNYFPGNGTFIQTSGFQWARLVESLSAHEVQNSAAMQVTFAMDFMLEYPSESERNFTFYSTGRSAIPGYHTPDQAYRVENDLEWNDDKVLIKLDNGKRIDYDGYVGGGARLVFYNLKVYYERSNIQPRPGIVTIDIIDNFGTSKREYIQQGKSLQTNWVAQSITSTMRFEVRMTNVPQENILSDPIEFQLKVDTNPPSYVGRILIHPDSLEDEPINIDNDYKVFVNWSQAEDAESGVAGYRLEASNGPFKIARDVLSGPYELGSRVGEEIPEGIVNISVRAFDNVGNFGPRSYTDLIIDHTGPKYDLIEPYSEVWIKDNRPKMKVRVYDELSGIDGFTLFYRWSRDNGFIWSQWQSCNYYGQGVPEQVVNLEPVLMEGRDNLVELKGNDLAASKETRSDQFRIFVDTRAPSISIMDLLLEEDGVSTEWIRDPSAPIKISVHDHLGSGIDPMKVTYRYSTDNGSTFSSDLPLDSDPFNNSLGYEEYQYLIRKTWSEGAVNLLVIDAYDKVGRNSTTVYRLRMDMAPEIQIISPVAGSSFLDNETIVFNAYIVDPDGNEELTVTWTSSIIGVIGSTPMMSTTLSPGEHMITLTVKDGVHTEKRVFTLNVNDHTLEDPAKKDSDGDGMNDAWELLYGFDPFDPLDAKRDPDGDGYTNLQEYLAGTDPLDPASYPGASLREERFPVVMLALFIVGMVLVLISGALVVWESRRQPPQPSIMMPPMMYNTAYYQQQMPPQPNHPQLPPGSV
ncbi:MAG: hypothetical protein QCI82_11110 [Candidatus Thermoplasmatota archaeon]|nr:hypothetical protein [Candidatus Thermoplasmatota archaeon]